MEKAMAFVSNKKTLLRQAFITISVTTMFLVLPPKRVSAEECMSFDFQSLFFEDFYPSQSKWDNSSGNRIILWSATHTTILGSPVIKQFSEIEMQWIRSAFQSWDDASGTLKFTEASNPSEAEISVGYVDFSPSLIQQNIDAYWNYFTDQSNFRNKATVKIGIHEESWLANKNRFIHVLQHEIGNVLGLGDIRPSAEIVSVQEDTWQEPYGNIPLSDFDTGMIRQLYGESTCPSTFPSRQISEVDLKAEQELAAKTEAKSKASKKKLKISITCIKGKSIKKLVAVNPKCPSGYKKK
jgi:hypothetical protein